MENDSQNAGASLKDLLAQRKALDARIESLTRVRFAGPPERVSAIDKVARVMVQFKLTVQELEDAIEMIAVGLRISDQEGDAALTDNRPQRKKPGPKPGFKRKPKPASSSEASAPAAGVTAPETSGTVASQSPFSLSSQNDSATSVG